MDDEIIGRSISHSYHFTSVCHECFITASSSKDIKSLFTAGLVTGHAGGDAGKPTNQMSEHLNCQ